MKARAIFQAMLCGAGLALLAAQAVQAAIPVPAPTPAQQEAAAAKKAKADAQAAKAKQELADSMDAVTAHWRARAASQGWKSRPPVAIAAAAPAAAANGGASSGAPTAQTPGQPAAQSTAQSGGQSAAQPAGQAAGSAGAANVNPPIRSEKLGTAPPSADVKAHPTRAEPAGTPPAVVKNTPKVKNR